MYLDSDFGRKLCANYLNQFTDFWDNRYTKIPHKSVEEMDTMNVQRVGNTTFQICRRPYLRKYGYQLNLAHSFLNVWV